MTSQAPRQRRRTQHARLAAILRDAILNGTHPVGSRLPTESMLCETHGLSRGTVRVALRTLEDQGLITRRPGAGTTVVSRDPVDAYLPFVSNRDELIALYRHTGVARPDSTVVEIDATEAERTGLPTSSHWTVLQGPRHFRRDPDGPALCWTEQFLRADLPSLDPEAAASYTADMPAHRIEQIVRAVSMPERFAEPLDAVAGTPALMIRRRHIDVDGQVVSASLHTHPGDRFALTTMLVAEQ